MKQVFFTKRGGVEVAEVPTPSCGPGELLVCTHYSLISAGTELKSVAPSPRARAARRRGLMERAAAVLREEGVKSLYDRARDQTNLASAPGYSAAGVVVRVGEDVVGFSPGDRVACAGAGAASHAEHIRVPPMLCAHVPGDVSLDEACWATVAAIAMQGVRQGRPALGETVVVSGLGLLGLISLQLARASGARVVALDLDPARVARARALGAEAALDPRDEGPTREAIEVLSGGIGADVVLVCATSTSTDPMRQALEWVRQRGRVVLVGDVPITIPRQPFYQKEAEVTIACSYGPGRYDPLYEQGGLDYPPGFVRWTEQRNLGAVLDAMAAGRLDVKALSTHCFEVGEAQAAYDALRDPARGALGVVLRYPAAHGEPPAEVTTTRVRAAPARSGRLGVAVIGAGGFATSVHLPRVARHERSELRVVASRTGLSAAAAARRFGGVDASTDWREAIDRPDVHAVVVATRHDSHAEIAAFALGLGKAVLVEKPLGLSAAEIDEVMKARAAHGAPLLVGHNRRFAPAAQAIRARIADRGGPCSLLYRVNAGAISADHWTQDRATGGGRVIGEGSHFLDLLGYLVGDSVPWRHVQGTCTPPDGARVSALDTYSATIAWDDGSHAVLHYTALGHRSLPKERLEVAGGGWSAVLDDFTALVGYGPGAPSWTGRGQDKGFDAQWDAFLRAAQGDVGAIPSAFAQARVARVVVDLDAALRAHGHTPLS